MVLTRVMRHDVIWHDKGLRDSALKHMQSLVAVHVVVYAGCRPFVERAIDMVTDGMMDAAAPPGAAPRLAARRQRLLPAVAGAGLLRDNVAPLRLIAAQGHRGAVARHAAGPNHGGLAPPGG